MNTQIIFSHGMGVLRDNRGLFPMLEAEIRKSSSSFDFHYFDYNLIDGKEVHVRTFSEQTKILQRKLDEVTEQANGARVYIIGQSQGSLIPAFTNLQGIYKVIGISPFFHTKQEDILKRYQKSEQNEVNFNGVTKRYRSDGTVTVMPSSYWQERFHCDPEALYNSMATRVKLTLVCPLQDEIMDITNLTKIKNCRIINLDGDHDFNGEERQKLLEYVAEEVGY